MTLPHVPFPPLQPLSPAQCAFLDLHAHNVVTSWRWHFCETQLRATAGLRKATIWRDDLEDLVARGLMTRGVGYSMALTELGREAATVKEAT